MSLSKVVISGRVIRPPEKRFTPNTNTAVTDFSIAVDSAPRQDGSAESYPVKVIAWRDLAERLPQELKKGDLVTVDGRLQINSYTNSEGQRRREFEIEAVAVDNLNALVSGTASPATVANPRAVVKSGAKAATKGTGTELSGDDLDAIFASEDEIPF